MRLSSVAVIALAALGLVTGTSCASDPRGHEPLDAGSDAARAAPAPDRQEPDAALVPIAQELDAGSEQSEEEDAGAPDAAAAPVDAAADVRRERLPLVDHRAWAELPVGEDPWNDRPSDATCAEGFGYEIFQDQDSYVVDTSLCRYRTAEQPTLTEIRAGEEVVSQLWYFELFGPPGAEAHVALRIGERDLLDEVIPIPATSALLRAKFIADDPIPAGTPVMLHVHNHGANQYYLLELSTGPAEP